MLHFVCVILFLCVKYREKICCNLFLLLHLELARDLWTMEEVSWIRLFCHCTYKSRMHFFCRLLFRFWPHRSGLKFCFWTNKTKFKFKKHVRIESSNQSSFFSKRNWKTNVGNLICMEKKWQKCLNKCEKLQKSVKNLNLKKNGSKSILHNGYLQ